jgi:epsilon-lactone hydrolase
MTAASPDSGEAGSPPSADNAAMGDEPTRYLIRVTGHLGPTGLAAFPAMVCQRQGSETVLTGLLPDRSALYGVLAEIETLGLELIELRRLAPPVQP